MDMKKCFTFSLGSYSKQAGDERQLTQDISFVRCAGYLDHPSTKLTVWSFSSIHMVVFHFTLNREEDHGKRKRAGIAHRRAKRAVK
jgi:hypothetical protein